MAYLLQEIEITEPLPELDVPASCDGVALVVRRYRRPVGFLMMPAAIRSWDTPTLERAIASETGSVLLESILRDEIKTEHWADRSPADAKGFPSVTVAICTRDRSEKLARCAGSILDMRETRPNVPDFEILVVDNAPTDDQTREWAGRQSEVRYVREKLPGLDFARNRAIAEAGGDLLAFLDDDVVVDREWLWGLMEAHQENPDAAGFTGLVLPYELETKAQVLFEQGGGFRRGFAKIRYGSRLANNRLYPVGAGIFGAGCNMVFRTQVLRELGGFDEALDTGPSLPGGGDLDIFYRMISAGHRLVYEPRLLVFHDHRRTQSELRRQYRSWGLGFLAFVSKTYQNDPASRAKVARTVAWWFRYQSRRWMQGLLRKSPTPATMVAAELWGGVVGLLGEYGRSQRRIRRLKERFSQN